MSLFIKSYLNSGSSGYTFAQKSIKSLNCGNFDCKSIRSSEFGYPMLHINAGLSAIWVLEELLRGSDEFSGEESSDILF